MFWFINLEIRNYKCRAVLEIIFCKNSGMKILVKFSFLTFQEDGLISFLMSIV